MAEAAAAEAGVLAAAVAEAEEAGDLAAAVAEEEHPAVRQEA